jgi:hypothetical protein
MVVDLPENRLVLFGGWGQLGINHVWTRPLDDDQAEWASRVQGPPGPPRAPTSVFDPIRGASSSSEAIPATAYGR